MTTPNEFLANLAATKGEGWVKLLQKWIEVKAEIDAVPSDDVSLIAIKQRNAVIAMNRECCVQHIHGVPTALYDDAATLRQLQDEELRGDGADEGNGNGDPV